MIEHVSDTALWIAAYRAMETERPDAAFQDPLAARLAGDRGRAIAADMPSPRQMAFAMTVRTVSIDRLIDRTISHGVDTVISLGAGLDTRSYRMLLPETLRWVEVDHGPLLDYKAERLRTETPACRVERVACDLSRDEERRSLLSRLGRESRTAVILTEGLIPYLTPDQAAALSKDLLEQRSFEFWIQDYRQGKLRASGEKKLEAKLHRAPILFNIDDPLGFFGAHGWRVREDLHILDVADSIGRKLPFMLPWGLLAFVAPGLLRRLGNRAYGCVLLERS